MPTISMRTLLTVDAATCALMALLLLTGASLISDRTAIPVDLLRYAGLLLIPFAALMIATAARSAPWAVGAVIIGNLCWVVATLAILLTRLIEPNVLGGVLLVGQAAAVGLLAVLEFGALTRPHQAELAR